MVNLPTKFDIAYLHPLGKYEKRRKMLKMGWFGVVKGKVTENSTIR